MSLVNIAIERSIKQIENEVNSTWYNNIHPTMRRYIWIGIRNWINELIKLNGWE